MMADRAPAIPAHLSADARAEWRRIAPQAHAAGTLTPATARAFALLAELLANERVAAAAVAADGVTVTSAAGTKKPHPAIRSLEIARSQAMPLLKQFGLLPAAPKRSRKERPEAPPPNGKSVWDGVLT